MDKTISVLSVRQNPVLSGTKCQICHEAFRKPDAILRTCDYAFDGVRISGMHRRCVQALLDEGPEDEYIQQEKFNAYVAKIAERDGLQTLA